jgi:cation diffusion facilitator family transporter
MALSLHRPGGTGDAPSEGVEESRTAVVAALLGNLALAILKGVAAAITGSVAMLAETFHSIADTGNQALLFVGMRMARRPPDAEHPFGHGKNVYFWSFVVSVMLFTLGGAFSIWEGAHKILAPGEPQPMRWAFFVLAGAFVFESISLTVAVRSLRRLKDHRSLREYVTDNRDPTLLTVLLEDTSALVSLILAAGGLTLTELTGRTVWDGAASLAIGLVLVAVALVLAVENHSLLMGESAPRDVLERIVAVARRDAAVERVLGLRTMHLGPEALLVVLQVDFRDTLGTPGVEAATERLRRAVAEAAGERDRRRLVVIEPSAAAPAKAA